MKYKDIFYLKEEQYYAINQRHFKNFVESFKNEFRIDITELAKSEGIPNNDFVKQFYLLKYAINLYYPKYIPEFFARLEASGFDVSSEIVDAMKTLGVNTIDALDEDLKQYILLSPYIQGLSINQGKIMIYSDEFGDYSFYSTRKYLLSNKKALAFIRKYVTQNYCHQASWSLIQYLDNANLLTSLLPAYFEGNYYHSVIRNQDGLIVDAANQVVYDEKTRDFLFKGNIVAETKKEHLNCQLQVAKEEEDHESKEIDFPKALLLALHRESKAMKKN